MDELAYHESRRAINPLPCVFERAILAGCVQCGLSGRQALAEREVVACTSMPAHINCTTLERLLHERATFALRLPRPGVPIAHAKVMQLQCGGLRGLQAVLQENVADVHSMVQKAQANEASLLDLPWGKIVADIVAWQMRRRTATPAR